jgi:hypothetical protein
MNQTRWGLDLLQRWNYADLPVCYQEDWFCRISNGSKMSRRQHLLRISQFLSVTFAEIGKTRRKL